MVHLDDKYISLRSDIRVAVDLHLVAKYSKQAEVIRVRVRVRLRK